MHKGTGYAGEHEVREALTTLDPLWAQRFPAEQARVIQLLIDRVEIETGGLTIRFRNEGLAEMATDLRTATTKNRKVAT